MPAKKRPASAMKRPASTSVPQSLEAIAAPLLDAARVRPGRQRGPRDLLALRCQVYNDQRGRTGLDHMPQESVVVMNAARNVPHLFHALEEAFFCDGPGPGYHSQGIALVVNFDGVDVRFGFEKCARANTVVADPSRYLAGPLFHKGGGKAVLHCGDQYSPMTVSIELAPEATRKAIDEINDEARATFGNLDIAICRFLNGELPKRIPGVSACVL